MKKSQLKSYFAIFIIIILFILSSYFIQNNLNFFNQRLNPGFVGYLIFILVVIISIVFAPVSAIPLFPIASNLWGWPLTGVLSILGWTIGAVIAFLLARHYGVDLVKNIISLKQLKKFEEKIPQEHLFSFVVLFRMITPIDGLSYFLGLFTNMNLRSFTIATIIGITPFSFVIAYLGSIPFIYTSIVILIFLIIFLIYLIFKKIKNQNI